MFGKRRYLRSRSKIVFQAYGHSIGKEQDIPPMLSEVSIASDPEGLRALARYLRETARTMEEMGDTFDHTHLQPTTDHSDLVITRLPEDYREKALAYDLETDIVVELKLKPWQAWIERQQRQFNRLKSYWLEGQ